MSVAVRPAAEDRAAGHAAASLAREHQRVAADLGAGFSFLTMRRKMACSAGGKTFAAGFPNKLGFAPANLLRPAFRAGDGEVTIEEEHEIEGGEKQGSGALYVQRPAGLVAAAAPQARLGCGAGAAPFLPRQPAHRPADGFEGAQLLGCELAN